MLHRGEGVLAVDLAGNVTYVNRAAELMSGRTRHDLLGHPLERLFETIEDAVPRGLSVATRLAPGERHRANTSDAWVLDPQEGLRILIRYSAEAIHDRAGGIAGAIIVFRGATTPSVAFPIQHPSPASTSSAST